MVDSISGNTAKIILLGTLSAVAYGIVLDQITVRLCIEYFTVAHPPLVHTTSPTLLAICWGSVASVWAGLTAGILLALVSQSPNLPPIPLSRLCWGTAVLLATMGLCAALAGTAGYELARHGIVPFPTVLAHKIPADHHDGFMADWFAHNTSYLVGFGGAGTWIYRLWRERGKPHVLSPMPRTKWAVARTAVFAAIIIVILHSRLSGR